MTTRRHFLAGSAAFLAAGAALAGRSAGADVARPAPGYTFEPGSLPANPEAERYRPPYRLGMGGAPMAHAGPGRPYRPVLEAVEAAWESGVRYFDTSPWYNLGLGERRFGVALHGFPRDEFVISTKVGRILHPDASVQDVASWENPPPFRHEYDYSASGTRRSIEESLQRLGTSHIDIVFIHDLSPDNSDLGDDWERYFEQAVKGAMPELTRMRDEGIIKAWGMGVNRLEPSTRAFEVADPDIILQACKYSLIDHQDTVEQLFPLCEKRGASVVVGSPLNNGFLAGRNRYNYSGKIPDGALQKRARLSRLAFEHGTDLRTAALHFCNAPEVVSAVIPGSRNLSQSVENAASMREKVPAEFWRAAVKQGLIAESAPLPV
ncbi:MAG: aldo/keto reductase [Alloalcanivorax venustensis]|uniref:aldo/keto reductase n=1 Tax=Alloalcanivorax venustensis TaxID=172371 RepID=UPI0030034FA5